MAKIRQEDRTPVLGRILKYLKPYWWLLTLALLCAVATVTCTLTGPVLVGRTVDMIVGPGQVDFTGILGMAGWLAGVYIALQGAGVALVGALARWGFGSMFAGSHQMMGGVGLSGGGWTYSGPPELEGAIMGELGVVQATPFSGFESFIMGFATVILAIGILMILGGLILAFVLWKNGKKGD